MFEQTSKLLARLSLATLFALPLGFESKSASACGYEPYLGSICLFAGTFTPRGFAPADGRLLAISQNTALFALIGNTYGGDGTATFALPDLRGRAPVGIGSGPGLSSYKQGQTGGDEYTTLNVGQLPAHTHATTVTATATRAVGNTNTPEGAAWATDERDDNYFTGKPPSRVKMSAESVQVTVGYMGESKPIDNRQPYLAVRWMIALQGVYPSRN